MKQYYSFVQVLEILFDDPTAEEQETLMETVIQQKKTYTLKELEIIINVANSNNHEVEYVY